MVHLVSVDPLYLFYELTHLQYHFDPMLTAIFLKLRSSSSLTKRSTKKNPLKSRVGGVVAWPGVHPWCRSALTAKDRGSWTVKPADTQHVPSGLMHDNGTCLRLLLHNKSTMMIRQAAIHNCE
jgi:hypothetical protein